MSNFDKHLLAFSPPHIRFGPINNSKTTEKDESLVFVTIWDCRTHVPMTSTVERTDLDFKISVALVRSNVNIVKVWTPPKIPVSAID